MANKSIIGLVLVAIVARLARAQFPFGNQMQNQNGGWNFGGMNGMNGLWGQNNNNNNNNVRLLTCIAKNTDMDEMRLTFTDEQDTQRNWWQGNWNRRQTIKLEASIRISSQSSTNGQFQLAVTENGRVEDGCHTAALGRIVDNFQNINAWFQPRRPANSESGLLGQPFMLAPNNGQQWSGDLEGFQSLDELLGRGVGLCRAGNIANGFCQYIIPLCCKVGWDSQRATQPIQGMNGMVQGMPGSNMQGSNPMNPMGNQMNPMNPMQPNSNPMQQQQPGGTGLGGLTFP